MVRLEFARADHCGAINAAPQEFEQKLLAWFSTRAETPHEPVAKN
jgi:hypothetical protein